MTMIFSIEENKVFITLAAIFLATQAIGLYTAAQYINYIDLGELAPAFTNPQDVGNSVFLVVYILLTTAVLLALIKFKKSLIRVLEAVAIFFASDIVFNFILPVPIFSWLALGDVLAIALTVWKMVKPTYFKQNVAMIFSVAGAGAVIGVSLGVLPALVFMLLLSIYDFISVFITKHMVYMAKAITETPTAFTAAIPSKKHKHVFQLGGGDLVMPLMFSASVMYQYGITSALITSAGALIAMMALFYLVLQKPGNALPALPPICAGACIAFVLSLLI